MKLNDAALVVLLSSGVLAAAQSVASEPKIATDAATQIAIYSAAVPDNTVLLLATAGANLTTAPPSAMNDEPTAAGPSSSDSPQASGLPHSARPAKSHRWRLAVTPYLWLPGVHGTMGALDRDVAFRASPIDLLSHFRFGLMANAEARRSRFVLPLDVFWIRLADSKALPFPNLEATTADVKASAFVLTPKAGYRLVDERRIKLDVLTGFRYFHLGQNLKFSPSNLDLDLSRAQNWVDPLVGARIEAPLSGKLVVNLASDVGGWGVGSQLDYQATGLLGYKIKENVTVQAGYRYAFVNYRAGGATALLFNAALSGVAFGVTFHLE